MKILFMGTPDIAEVSLKALLREGHQVVGVFTREDKPVGRKQILTSPPVKKLADVNGIPVYQPKTLRDPEMVQIVKQHQPELIVVVAYGMMLPAEILEFPEYGCINLHVSMLPKYRGAAPIQWAVINGETETGVTIMQMDEGMDTGDIIAQQTLIIGAEQTAGEVFEMVTHIGARLLCQTVNDIAAGKAEVTPQQGEVSMAPQLTKAMAELDFARPARELHNLVRGCNPWPLAWFIHDGQRIKVLRTKIQDEGGETPGELISLNPLTIACGEGALTLDRITPEGKRPMTGTEWAAGRRFERGACLDGQP